MIREFLAEHDITYTGGCTPFYSPEEWRHRGEDYGTNSHLIVVYDGGDLSALFGGCLGALYDDLTQSLNAHGLYFEHCTAWYSAVYSS